MADALIVRGGTVVTGGGLDDPVLAGAAVLVEDGTIREVGDWPSIRNAHPEARVLGSDRFAVIPGLINAHHHSAGATALQHGIPDLLLECWLVALRGKRASDPYLDTLLSAARLLRSGVTTVVEVHSDTGTAESYAARARRALSAYDEAGIRVAFAAGFREQSLLVAGAGEDAKFLASLPADLRAEAEETLPGRDRITVDEYFGVIADLWREHENHPRIDLWFAPPGPQWVSDAFMERIAERAEAYDTGIQTHVEESFYEKLHGPRDYGRPTVLHLRELGVLGPRFSIAHGVWLSEPEIEALAETGAGVSHNPSSNLRLRAGIAPLNALLAAGVTTALGMDGTTLNDDEDMFTEMRLALRLHRTPMLGAPAPAPTAALRMATAGGARLLRREASLGRLAPGFAADMVLIDLDRVRWPWTAPEADPRALLAMRAKAEDVDTVLVGGEVVFRDGRPTRFDMDAAGRELFERLRELRLSLARSQDVPPYVIFHDKTLVAMASERPSSRGELAEIPGVGERKLERYGDAFLGTIAGDAS